MRYRTAKNCLTTEHALPATTLEARQFLDNSVTAVAETAATTGLRPGQVVTAIRTGNANAFPFTQPLQDEVQNLVTDNFVLKPINFPAEWNPAERDTFQQAAQQAVDWWEAATDRRPLNNQYDKPIPVTFDFKSQNWFTALGNEDGLAGTESKSLRNKDIYINKSFPQLLSFTPAIVALAIAHEIGHGAFGLEHITGGPRSLMHPLVQMEDWKLDSGSVAKLEKSGAWYFLDDSLIV